MSAAPQHFATTQWSVVLAAGDVDHRDVREALGQLCEGYWYPVYAYVRRSVNNVDDAQDLTQAFFTQLLEKGAVAHADPQRGRFRSFLLTALKNFLTNEWRKARAQKRGGKHLQLSIDLASAESKYQIEPAHDLTPEKMFERRWVTTLLNQVLARLQTELEAAGKAEHFARLKDGLTGELSTADYEQTAAALGITPAAAKQAAYRFRKRYRQLFRAEVARTVADDAEVDQEIGQLLETLGT